MLFFHRGFLLFKHGLVWFLYISKYLLGNASSNDIPQFINGTFYSFFVEIYLLFVVWIWFVILKYPVFITYFM